MTRRGNPPKIPLPRGWLQSVKGAMLHVISLAQFGMAYTCGWCVGPPILALLRVARNVLPLELLC